MEEEARYFDAESLLAEALESDFNDREGCEDTDKQKRKGEFNQTFDRVIELKKVQLEEIKVDKELELKEREIAAKEAMNEMERERLEAEKKSEKHRTIQGYIGTGFKVLGIVVGAGMTYLTLLVDSNGVIANKNAFKEATSNLKDAMKYKD